MLTPASDRRSGEGSPQNEAAGQAHSDSGRDLGHRATVWPPTRRAEMPIGSGCQKRGTTKCHRVGLAGARSPDGLSRSRFESSGRACGTFDRAWNVFGGIDLAFVAYGAFAEYDAAEEPETLLRLLETNFVSAAHLTSLLARKLSETGGKVAVITSVAGDRGRKRITCMDRRRRAYRSFCKDWTTNTREMGCESSISSWGWRILL